MMNYSNPFQQQRQPCHTFNNTSTTDNQARSHINSQINHYSSANPQPKSNHREDNDQNVKIMEEFKEWNDYFTIIDYLGSGAYGIVCAVREVHSSTFSTNSRVSGNPLSSMSDTTTTGGNNTSTSYALKKCKNIFSSRTLAKRTLREIRLLRYFTHPNIIPLQRVMVAGAYQTHAPHDDENEGSNGGNIYDTFKDVYFLFDLMDTDLAQIIKSPQRLKIEHIQFFTYQLLQALAFLHGSNVIHRDIK
jgi:serine/threonine protein kinase